MLSKVFHQYNRTLSIFTVLFLLATIGCGSKTVDLTSSQDHPANPEGKQGTVPAHGGMPTAEMHAKNEGHSSTALSHDGTEALAAMLDAYITIGSQLASDTMDDVNEKAHAMIEAFHTVEHEVPAELWNAHASHTKTIRDTGHQLADLSDIKAARIAYGSLSDSFTHLITALGIPTSYGKTVYSYVCGMAPDVPKAGIWMQTDEPVRNPYFGSAMLRCHTVKTQMSASSTDMSGGMDMESHKHSH